MLTVLGAGTQAVLAAAYASATSGEVVGVTDPEFGARGMSRQLSIDGLAGETASAELVRCDLDGLARSEQFVMVGQAVHLVDMCDHYAEFLAGKQLLLAPGCFAGAARAAAAFDATHRPAPVIGELPGFPVIGDLAGDRARVRGVKVHMPCGTLTPTASHDLVGAYAPYLPPMRPARSLETSLSNTNNAIHPPIVLANLATISCGVPLRFYREGISPAVGNLIRAIDADRMAVAAAAGVKLPSIDEVFRLYYSGRFVADTAIEDILLGFPGFQASLAPTSLDHRYIDDDVGYGIACIAALGDLVGVATPAIDAMVTLISAATGRDLGARASGLAALLVEAEQISTHCASRDDQPNLNRRERR